MAGIYYGLHRLFKGARRLVDSAGEAIKGPSPKASPKRDYHEPPSQSPSQSHSAEETLRPAGPATFGRKQSAFGTAGAMPGQAAGPAGPTLVNETVSVVLRRQVPPRFDEPERSWFGGLPCMPDRIEWPRSVSQEYPDQGERPLHFVAQIQCEDLPRALWGGRGPRTGWLLLFIDPNVGCPESAESFRIIHFDLAAGEVLPPERKPPFDLGSVHDGIYTGPSYVYMPEGQTVANQWRSWPIDLVTVANEAREEDGRTLVAPDNFAPILYEGAPVAEDNDRLQLPYPFTYGLVADAVRELKQRMERRVPSGDVAAELRTMLFGPDGWANFIAQCDDDLADMRRQKAEAEAKNDPQAEWHTQRVATLGDKLDLLRNIGSLEGADAIIEEGRQSQQMWQDKICEQCIGIIEKLEQQRADAAYSRGQWEALQAQFAELKHSRWTLPSRLYGEKKIDIHVLREEVVDAALNTTFHMGEEVKSLYLSRSRRYIVPADIREAYEPHWRTLYNNRPHRMGGYHDGLQSDAVIGPTKDLLLFQIATDDAMNWCWGDGGCYYFYIRPEHLEALDFSGVQIELECH